MHRSVIEDYLGRRVKVGTLNWEEVGTLTKTSRRGVYFFKSETGRREELNQYQIRQLEQQPRKEQRQ